MAGTYRQGEHKDLSGVYTRIVAILDGIEQGARGIVAYPFTADWGPVNQLVDSYFETDFRDTFNAEKNTTLTANKILTHAFPGKPSLVIGYRMATAVAKKGEATLPAASQTAWVIETLYPSARPFVVKIADSLAGGKSLEFAEGGNEVVKVTGDSVDTLAAAINATDFFRVKTKGSALPDNAASVQFSGGHNGQDVTGTEYANFRTELEGDGRAKYFALDDYTDAAEVAATEAWVLRVRAEGVYISFANGGPSTWDNDIDAANIVSKAFNERAIINVGNGADGYTAGDVAIYVAARAASVPLNRTLTDEVTPYKKVNKKLSKSQRIVAKKAGTLVLIQRGDFVEIDEAVNTFTVVTDPEHQKKEFGKIRVHNTLDQIATDLEVFGDEYKKTRSNTPAARETYAALVETEYFAPLIGQEVLQVGATYRPNLDYHGPNPIYTARIDEAYFKSGVQPVDSMEKIYQELGVSFR
ncbi:phage tail protein [Metabacillus fastidiosus]|uniref:phage tail protein n=1 Tax=Metabacillus fastidiosus TaxID=1458 RepID=UPI003D2E4305